ncbi:MAG: hypothetical protein EOP06_02960 [Proteobacteria bacterium]|nr:MAG: hypothetical protein EOP06_02960 [Pseudomonadota bacterium]
MKSVLSVMIALLLAPSAFAKTSGDSLRLKIAAIPEVKAVYSVYKGRGWTCEDTVVQAQGDDSFTASKSCVEKDSNQEESGVTIQIKGTIFGSGSSQALEVESITFTHAG